MVEATYVITGLLAYRVIKKNGVGGMDRPVQKEWSHLHAIIIIGQIFFVLGQHFLLTTPSTLLIPDWAILILVILSLLLSDAQDVVFKKRPLWLYTFILLEYIAWSTLSLIAFISGQFAAGTLLLLSCFSKVADFLHLYKLTIASKGS